jgi:hypothetical protein
LDIFSPAPGTTFNPFVNNVDSVNAINAAVAANLGIPFGSALGGFANVPLPPPPSTTFPVSGLGQE